jgi:hypothetical protein
MKQVGLILLGLSLLGGCNWALLNVAPISVVVDNTASDKTVHVTVTANGEVLEDFSVPAGTSLIDIGEVRGYRVDIGKTVEISAVLSGLAESERTVSFRATRSYPASHPVHITVENDTVSIVCDGDPLVCP